MKKKSLGEKISLCGLVMAFVGAFSSMFYGISLLDRKGGFLIGLAVILGGFLLSLTTGLLMAGFGQLVDDTHYIKIDYMEKRVNENSATTFEEVNRVNQLNIEKQKLNIEKQKLAERQRIQNILNKGNSNSTQKKRWCPNCGEILLKSDVCEMCGHKSNY